MESTRLTTRTYTAPTCTLYVNTKAAAGLPNLPQLNKPHAIDFTLHLDRPEQGESGRVTLKGNPQQLDLLQQSVSGYVAELVAKFPLQTPNNNATVQPQEPGILVPEHPAPALREESIAPSTPLTTPDQIETPTSVLSTKNISKLLGLSTPEDRERDRQQSANIKLATTEPLHLTGGDNNLDHKLHLGNLATATSGAVLTLSAIQLFDLSTALEEYTTEVAAPKSTGIHAPTPVVPTKTPDLKVSSPATPTDKKDTDTFTAGNTPLSRLPNLPKRSTTNSTSKSQAYDYDDAESRSPFLSVIPWAAAAAIAVGVPLMLFGSKSNSLKDLTNNVKLPDGKAIESAKQSVMSYLPGKEKPGTTSGTETEAKTPDGVPKPWEQQPVQAPTAKANGVIPGTQPGQPDKIGIAPLPPAIGTQAQTPGSAKPVASNPVGNDSSVAPNPLSSPSIPVTAPIPSAQASVSTPVTTIPIKPVKPVKISTAPVPKPPAVNKFNPSKTGSIGIVPKPSVGSSSPAYSTQIPFTPPMISGDGINPTPVKATTPKKAATPKKVATKPKKAVTPKPSPSPLMAPEPLPEQFTESPNPNIISPLPQTSSEGADVQNLPIIPEAPVKSNISPSSINSDPFDSPALKEAKVYFQRKWQADPAQVNPLQYVVSVNSKTGVVRSVKPQNDDAITYLKKSGLIKPGQKLVSGISTGGNEQRIRVLLQPTGDVDAFMEP